MERVFAAVHCHAHQQVPPLRLAIDEANRKAPVEMAEVLVS